MKAASRGLLISLGALALLSCGVFIPRTRSLPPSGQILRDAEDVLRPASKVFENYSRKGATNFRVKAVARDQYEKDLCTATVLYDWSDYTGVVALSYRWADGFWRCTAGIDSGWAGYSLMDQAEQFVRMITPDTRSQWQRLLDSRR